MKLLKKEEDSLVTRKSAKIARDVRSAGSKHTIRYCSHMYNPAHVGFKNKNVTEHKKQHKIEF